jgi:acyl transferase domain-containing protein
LGVTGLINAVQALVHKQLPPAIHFKSPNSHIDLANSPFYVNTKLSPWKAGSSPRRAGVSAFGVGGTNAHVVVEEAPHVEPVKADRPGHLLVFSARTATALGQSTTNLVEHLKANPEIDLGSIAFTLQAGRRAFNHRRAIVCVDRADAISALQLPDSKRLMTGVHDDRDPRVVFMFPGQGAQYSRMGMGLYRWDRQFRLDIDSCAEILKPRLGFDLRFALYPTGDGNLEPDRDLRQTELAQPALFVIEYALARLWMRWGASPRR